MNNYYEIEKNIEKILSGKSTNFLDGKMQNELKKRLNKINYNIFYSYKDSEKVIFYLDNKPNVVLFEIETKEKLKHQEIMGTVLNLGLDSEVFGDIIIDNNKYYIYVLDKVKEYLKMNFVKVKNTKITLKELNLDYLNNFERKYEERTIIVSSERIDNVISHIINISRDNVKTKIRDKEIILNYDILKSHTKILKNGDIFSIRRYGKYKYLGIIKNTKKDNLIIKYLKYL